MSRFSKNYNTHRFLAALAVATVSASTLAVSPSASALGGHENLIIGEKPSYGSRSRNPVIEGTMPSAPWGTAEEQGWFFPKNLDFSKLGYSRYGFGVENGDPWENLESLERNSRMVVKEQSLNEFLGTNGPTTDWMDGDNSNGDLTDFVENLHYGLEIYNSTGETRETRIAEADRLSKEYRKFFVMTAAILADIEKNGGLSPEVKQALQDHGYDGDFMAEQIGDLYGIEKLPDTRQDSPVLVDYKFDEYQTDKLLEVPTTADVMVMVLSSFHLAALYDEGIILSYSPETYEYFNTLYKERYGKPIEWGTI